jgi:hypothetical protein
MTKLNLNINKVDVFNIPKKTTFIHEGKLYVNSLMMPPINSKPLEATSIDIHCQPEQTSLEGQVLTIDFIPNTGTTAKAVK